MKKSMPFILLSSLFLLGGCAAGNSESSDTGVEQVQVGLGNAYPPFTYLDDSGEVQGYDYEVLKLVDEKLADYDFEYQTFEFKTLLTALDSKQVRLAAHQYEKNGERENRYLYGQEGYTEYVTYIATANNNAFDPQNLDDLVGKNVYVAQGTNFAATLEQYNAEHEEQINIKYGEMNMDVIVQEVLSGSADATLFTAFDLANVNAANDDAFKSSAEPVYATDTYFVFNSGDEELQQAVDGAVKELRDEGKLKELQEEIILP